MSLEARNNVTYEAMENKKEQGEFGFSEPVILTVPSSSEYVLLTRLVVSCAGQIAGFEPQDIYDLKLAVTEAVTNVIRHAKVDSFSVEYRILPQMAEITVIDNGGGFDASNLSGNPGGQEGGFGLAVIRSLVDEMVLDSTAGGGTRLKMIRCARTSQQ